MHPISRAAVVLVSGGLDSATTLAIAKSEGYVCHALSFCYGQRHAVELAAAERIARSLGVASHRVIDIDLRQFGGSALTSEMPVPKKSSAEEIGSEIPITYVPARNTIFLSFALAIDGICGEWRERCNSLRGAGLWPAMSFVRQARRLPHVRRTSRRSRWLRTRF